MLIFEITPKRREKNEVVSGNLHELEGSIHIGEASTPYSNAAYVISLGNEKIYLCDCSIQKLPVPGLYIVQGTGRKMAFPVKFSFRRFFTSFSLRFFYEIRDCLTISDRKKLLFTNS